MPIYVYRCDCGTRFERLLPRDAEAPACPECGRATRKIPAGAGLGGRAGGQATQRADTPRVQDGGTPPVQGLRSGGPEKVQREVQFRQRLEAKHAANTPPGAAGTGGGAAGPSTAG